jgi:hypothetical protein
MFIIGWYIDYIKCASGGAVVRPLRDPRAFKVAHEIELEDGFEYAPIHVAFIICRPTSPLAPSSLSFLYPARGLATEVEATGQVAA